MAAALAHPDERDPWDKAPAIADALDDSDLTPMLVREAVPEGIARHAEADGDHNHPHLRGLHAFSHAGAEVAAEDGRDRHGNRIFPDNHPFE